MNVTGYSSESAQSAIAANFTAFLSQTRSLLFLRTPPASAIRRSSPSRLSVPHGAELTQPLRLAQRRVSRNGGRLLVAFLLHPLAQRHLVHADIARHFYDRPTALDHEGHRLGLVLLSEATSSRSHDPYPSHEGQLHRLSGEPGTVQAAPTATGQAARRQGLRLSAPAGLAAPAPHHPAHRPSRRGEQHPAGPAPLGGRALPRLADRLPPADPAV